MGQSSEKKIIYLLLSSPAKTQLELNTPHFPNRDGGYLFSCAILVGGAVELPSEPLQYFAAQACGNPKTQANSCSWFRPTFLFSILSGTCVATCAGQYCSKRQQMHGVAFVYPPGRCHTDIGNLLNRTSRMSNGDTSLRRLRPLGLICKPLSRQAWDNNSCG